MRRRNSFITHIQKIAVQFVKMFFSPPLIMKSLLFNEVLTEEIPLMSSETPL